MTTNEKIEHEKRQAYKIYGHFHSTHEAYAVLLEEVDELWDIVKNNTDRVYGNREVKAKNMINELVQIAAISLRMIEELENDEIKFV
jgi:hypothetical protein